MIMLIDEGLSYEKELIGEEGYGKFI